ncbi:MAG: hypothetical protein IH822_05895 [Chloroflexi bacterium]|nr:hypothetical protein [Chloroflexota bacterium]
MDSSIKVRLKRALRVTERQLQIGKDGWLTNGHFAIHRGVLIAQGLKLGEIDSDENVLSAMGVDVKHDDGGPNCSKLKPKTNLVELEITRMSWQEPDVGTTVVIQSGTDGFSVFVQLVYLQLLADSPYGTKMVAEDAWSPLMPKGEPWDGQFIVMPMKPPKGVADRYVRLGENILDLETGVARKGVDA